MSIFCTSIHCMDGRIQEPIINFLKIHYNVTYVDSITEPGPCRILAENENHILINSILKRLEISIYKHKSKLIAVSGHHDCAGNPLDENQQKNQIKKAIVLCKNKYPDLDYVGLWIDNEWKVNIA